MPTQPTNVLDPAALDKLRKALAGPTPVTERIEDVLETAEEHILAAAKPITDIFEAPGDHRLGAFVLGLFTGVGLTILNHLIFK